MEEDTITIGSAVLILIAAVFMGMIFEESIMESRAIRAGVAEYNSTNRMFQFKTNHLTSPNNPLN